jgi:hypothetical protein
LVIDDTPRSGDLFSEHSQLGLLPRHCTGCAMHWPGQSPDRLSTSPPRGDLLWSIDHEVFQDIRAFAALKNSTTIAACDLALIR